MKLAKIANAIPSVVVAAAFVVATTAALTASAAPSGYKVTNTVSDFGGAPRQNPNLINPIGIDGDSQRTFIAENGTGQVTTLGNGNQQIAIPSVFGGTNLAKPTGIIVNPTLGSNQRGFFFTNVTFITNASNPTNIIITQRTTKGPATFITATEEGTIVAWNSSVNAKPMIIVNNSGSAAVYKGLTVATNSANEWRLYVANFHSSQVEVYDTAFNRVQTIDNPPFVPAGFAPFNVKQILGNVFIAYAKQGIDAIVDEPGNGNGYIAVANQDGFIVRDFAETGALNSPWGMAYAPTHFGKASHALLVGNNGDGRVNAYDIITSENLGPLLDREGNPVTIEGLWALEFNNDAHHKNFDYEASKLVFTSGPGGKTHGLVGTITSNAPFSNR